MNIIVVRNLRFSLHLALDLIALSEETLKECPIKIVLWLDAHDPLPNLFLLFTTLLIRGQRVAAHLPVAAESGNARPSIRKQDTLLGREENPQEITSI